MKHGTLFSALGLLALITPTTASAQQSIGTYSACKKLGSSAKAACLECVGRGGGVFYQVASKTCGQSPDMKPLNQAATKNESPPARPKQMPSSASQYVTIPAGSFRIGKGADERGPKWSPSDPFESDGSDSDDETYHATVTISHPFFMKTTEVTQAEWLFVMGDPGTSYDKACGDNCALGGVSWHRTLEYLNALSKREGLELCYDLTEKQAEWTKGVGCAGYRLPTEAEWEYAARGKTTTMRYGELDSIGWHSGNSDNKRHPVGQKTPNAYGLYDMLGSQWEWLWDARDQKKPGAQLPTVIEPPFRGQGDMYRLPVNITDPIGGGLKASTEPCLQGRCGSRMIRGGSFLDHVSSVRATKRDQYLWNQGKVGIGFRPVRTVIATATKK